MFDARGAQTEYQGLPRRQRGERPAAASFTAVPRSLAAAIGPMLAGAMMASGYTGVPLVACGVLKITYDLTLLRAFRRVKLVH